jgi:hypothetical protein
MVATFHLFMECPNQPNHFEAAYGRQLHMGMEPTCEHSDEQLWKVNDMVEKMKKMKQETMSVLKAAAEDMKRFYHMKQWPNKLVVGDEVWLNAKDLTTEQYEGTLWTILFTP